MLDATWADDLRAELGWLGGALGPVRDLDVLLLRLHREIASLPTAEESAGAVLLDALERERTTARGAMLEALTAPRYFALLERLADIVGAPLPTPGPTEAGSARPRRPRPGGGAQAAPGGRTRGDDPADEVLHALRIRGKRVRYTGELVAPSMDGTPDGKAVKRLLSATAALQEVLGDHQDACVAEQRIRGLLDGLDATPECPVRRRPARRAGGPPRRGEAREWRGAWERVDARIAGQVPGAVTDR